MPGGNTRSTPNGLFPNKFFDLGELCLDFMREASGRPVDSVSSRVSNRCHDIDVMREAKDRHIDS